MSVNKLYFLLLGCKPKGRHIEQHDVFVTIAKSLEEVIKQIPDFWPDAGTIHIDAWRAVTHLDGYKITIAKKGSALPNEYRVFFLNLGGYKPDEFEEYHYKLLAVADKKSAAIQAAKQTAFYKHTGFKGAASHIDDKYGIDIDDIYAIDEMLPKKMKAAFQLKLTPVKKSQPDQWHIGYLKLSTIK